MSLPDMGLFDLEVVRLAGAADVTTYLPLHEVSLLYSALAASCGKAEWCMELAACWKCLDHKCKAKECNGRKLMSMS